MTVNLRRRHALIAWTTERGLFVCVDRATPFVLGKDGARAAVIAAYRDHHLLREGLELCLAVAA